MMTIEVVVAHPTTPVKQVADLLVGHGLSALPVTDGQGRVLGVVSEADLLGGPQRPAGGPVATTAGEAMTSPAVTVSPHATLTEAARRMQARGVKRLPVVADSGRLIGIVSRADLLRPLVRPDEHISRDVEEMLERKLLVDPARVEVERRSLRPILVHLVDFIEGVVRIEDWLTFELDDTGVQPSSSNRQQI